MEDLLRIGNFVTKEKLQDLSLEYGAAVGKEYLLSFRIDKNAQDIGVLNVGSQDTSDVYEVVRLPIDEYCGSIVMEDSEIYSVHKGEHHFQMGYFPLTGSGVMNIVLETATKRPHVIFSVDSPEAGFIVETFEGIAANADGTLLPILNNDRLRVNGTETILRKDPTGVNTTGSTPIRSSINGTAGGTSQRTAGNVSRANELILKPNTKYLLRITNLSTSAINVNLRHEWTES